jgi:UDP-glucose 4-epimerase
MNCLVTGGAGFIGSHIVQALVKKGESVVLIDNFETGKRENLRAFQKKIKLIEGDILDKPLLTKTMKGIDVVLHQAALKLVPESFGNPGRYNDVNIQGTLFLLEEAKRQGVRKFVYASSSSVYGDSEKLPKRETDLALPISPYAVSKLAAENYCQVFTKNYHLPTVSLRYFNVFGPRQTVNDGYSNVIPKFISCFLKNKPLPVYGDGKQSRDFTYIDNVVNANLMAVEKEDVTGVYNVGMGERHDLLMIIQILEKAFNRKAEIQFLPPQKGDVRQTLASLDSIEKELGYRSLLSFEEGLRKTVDWFMSTAEIRKSFDFKTCLL